MKLESCHKDIIIICEQAIKIIDFTVLEGHRSEQRQRDLYLDGKSKLDGIKKKSKHQGYPSMAVDIAPYPIDWDDANRFYFLSGVMFGLAHELYLRGDIDHSLRWGGDWDKDMKFDDQKFDDLPHFELV
jgi:peptidoglycan L-alanyl-D-glutamate endopeptidase CwlK